MPVGTVPGVPPEVQAIPKKGRGSQPLGQGQT